MLGSRHIAEFCTLVKVMNGLDKNSVATVKGFQFFHLNLSFAISRLWKNNPRMLAFYFKQDTGIGITE